MKITTNSLLPNVQKFVEDYGNYAIDIQLSYGLPALAVLSQAAIETGWGACILRVFVNGVRINSNNMFNIKAHSFWTGKKGSVRVNEWVNGKEVWDNAYFRVYDSIQQSFDDYADYILTRKKDDGSLRYQRAIENKDDPNKYIEEVHKAGYATAPDYSDECKIIIRKYFQLVEV